MMAASPTVMLKARSQFGFAGIDLREIFWSGKWQPEAAIETATRSGDQKRRSRPIKKQPAPFKYCKPIQVIGARSSSLRRPRLFALDLVRVENRQFKDSRVSIRVRPPRCALFVLCLVPPELGVVKNT